MEELSCALKSAAVVHLINDSEKYTALLICFYPAL